MRLPKESVQHVGDRSFIQTKNKPRESGVKTAAPAFCSLAVQLTLESAVAAAYNPGAVLRSHPLCDPEPRGPRRSVPSRPSPAGAFLQKAPTGRPGLSDRRPTPERGLSAASYARHAADINRGRPINHSI
jgi:hypothetical protein